jgi:hypothetical protein
MEQDYNIIVFGEDSNEGEVGCYLLRLIGYEK